MLGFLDWMMEGVRQTVSPGYCPRPTRTHVFQVHFFESSLRLNSIKFICNKFLIMYIFNESCSKTSSACSVPFKNKFAIWLLVVVD